MFICQVLGKISAENEKLNKITVQTRAREYKHWDYEAEEVWSSYGTEIIKEINASAEGLAVWSRMSQEERDALVKSL